MKSSLLLATILLISSSFSVEAKINLKDKIKEAKDRLLNGKGPKKEGAKPEATWCSTIDMKDYPLNAPVYSAYSEKENIGYDNVRALVKEIFEENQLKLINQEMKDIETFCPKYSTLSEQDKEDFFGHLMANIARYESHYATGDAMAENNGNISRGLVGISYASLNPVYNDRGCKIITKDLDLADGKSNLQCGLAIISRWVEADKYLALDSKQGASRYWSTLRSPYKVCLSTYKRVVTVGFKEVIIEGLKHKMPSCF
jgi:hypothetical protein